MYHKGMIDVHNRDELNVYENPNRGILEAYAVNLV